MRQYQVPQFIDMEDKIVGPMTLRQFGYVLAGAALDLIAFYSLNFTFFIILAIPITIAALAMAFYTVDRVPFNKIAVNAMSFFTKPHLYLWKQLPPEKKKVEIQAAKNPELLKTPTLTESKLQDLAWSLDIKDKLE